MNIDPMLLALVWLAAICASLVSGRIILTIHRMAPEALANQSWFTLLFALLNWPAIFILLVFPFYEKSFNLYFTLTGIIFAVFVAPQVVQLNWAVFMYRFLQMPLMFFSVFAAFALWFEWIY